MIAKGFHWRAHHFLPFLIRCFVKLTLSIRLLPRLLSPHLLLAFPVMYFLSSDGKELSIFKTHWKCHFPYVAFSEHTGRIYHSSRTYNYTYYSTPYFFNYLFTCLFLHGTVISNVQHKAKNVVVFNKYLLNGLKMTLQWVSSWINALNLKIAFLFFTVYA